MPIMREGGGECRTLGDYKISEGTVYINCCRALSEVFETMAIDESLVGRTNASRACNG